MINHRGPEFAALIARTTEGVRKVFQTNNSLLTLTASGSGAMEAAVVNHIAPGEKVLIITIGVFGQRFVGLVNAYGAIPLELPFEFGSAADPAQVESVLKANPDIRTVLITHNETSTGTSNFCLPEVSEIAHRHDCLMIVDAISSLSSIPVKTDEWNLDVVLSGSQKGWMTAPGLAFVSVSERAWQRQAENPMPRFYFDLRRAKESLETGQTPWTPAVSLLFQLDKAIEMMLAEGMDAIYARHRRLARMTRDGIRALGLELLASEGVESDTVTAVKIPEGIDGSRFTRVAREQFETVFAGGQGPLAGKIFRFGHMGWVDENDIRSGLQAVEQTLASLGYAVANRA
jgi:aspartate aminotransferase-like enzyme